jgi:hypothetical protein
MVSGPLRAAPAIFCAELSGAEGEYLPVLPSPSGVAIFGPRYVAYVVHIQRCYGHSSHMT